MLQLDEQQPVEQSASEDSTQHLAISIQSRRHRQPTVGN
jgi:hypothetical protein